MSWFPKASIWNASGHNRGYWTADNEAWYQRRLLEIGDGGQPKNAQNWRAALGEIRANPVSTFKNTISNINDRFLRGDTSYWAQ
jgi:hypothetical protein